MESGKNPETGSLKPDFNEEWKLNSGPLIRRVGLPVSIPVDGNGQRLKPGAQRKPDLPVGEETF
jgi:hypothetical protein